MESDYPNKTYSAPVPKDIEEARVHLRNWPGADVPEPPTRGGKRAHLFRGKARK